LRIQAAGFKQEEIKRFVPKARLRSGIGAEK
jgi:hypothetical protein